MECSAQQLSRGGSGGSSCRSLILEDNVQRMDDTRDVTQDGEEDVDEKVGAAAAF